MARRRPERRFTNHGASAAVTEIRPGTRAAKVQAWLRAAADELGLKDWDVVYQPDEHPEEDGETLATCTTLEANHAIIRLSKEFFSKPARYQRLVLTHELCHLHTVRISEATEALEKGFAPEAYKVIARMFEDAEECVVESFARLLAERLTVPKF